MAAGAWSVLMSVDPLGLQTMIASKRLSVAMCAKINAQSLSFSARDEIRHRLLHRGHQYLRAHFDVAAKPLRQQPLDVRQAEIRDDASRQRDRQHEANQNRSKHRVSPHMANDERARSPWFTATRVNVT